MTQQHAYFLWVGGELPAVPRISILSAAQAGFRTTVFVDRPQELAHDNLEVRDYRDVPLPWLPEHVRLKHETTPCYAAFSDLFRFALLKEEDGWWFDCDTLILKDQGMFEPLLRPDTITVGEEGYGVINGAVLGSVGGATATLYEHALGAFPVLPKWGVVGPELITQLIGKNKVTAHVLDQPAFYPLHHSEAAFAYLPESLTDLTHRTASSYAISLWGEELRRSGLRHLRPPQNSFLGRYLARHGFDSNLTSDREELARHLAASTRLLDEAQSGTRAAKVLLSSAMRRTPLLRRLAQD